MSASQQVVSRGRYLVMWDVSVLLASTLVFLVFLILLMRIVFPQGELLGGVVSDWSSPSVEVDERGRAEIAASGIGTIGSFMAHLGDVRYDVKIRPADSVAWSSASKGDLLRNRDSVQTFSKSRARVDFTTDNELRIGQNSLVVFRSGSADPFLERREPAVVVMDGELAGTVNAEYGSFGVQLPAGLVELTAEDRPNAAVNFRVGVNPDDSSTIAVYSGQADINIAGEHFLVPANHGLTISKDGRSAGARALPSLPPIRTPNDNTVAKYLEVPPRVRFRWGRVSNAQNYRLEIARDAGFEEVLVDEYLNDTSFTHGNLAPGDYYWRISARSGWVQGPASLQRRLSVVRDAVPPLLELQPIQRVAAGKYVLRGRTASNAKVYVLGQSVKTSGNGNFEYLFNPGPGTQTIVVESIDAVGNVAYGSQVLHVPGSSGGSD